MPAAARGGERGRAGAELGAAGGSGSAPGPAPVTLRRLCSPSRLAPAAHGPVSQAARPPRRLLRPQLRGRLLHLHRLDGGVQPAVDGGYGGTRRYPGAQGALGPGGGARGGALLPRLLAGGTSRGSRWGGLPQTSLSSAGLSRPKHSPSLGAAPGAHVPLLGLAPACPPGAAAWVSARRPRPPTACDSLLPAPRSARHRSTGLSLR